MTARMPEKVLYQGSEYALILWEGDPQFTLERIVHMSAQSPDAFTGMLEFTHPEGKIMNMEDGGGSANPYL